MRPRKRIVVSAVVALVAGLLAAPPLAATPPVAAPTNDPASGVAAKKRTGTVSGTVTLRGEPVADARAFITGPSGRLEARTDERGRFEIKAKPGRHAISVAAPHENAHTTWLGDTVRRPDAKKLKVTAGKTSEARISLQPAVAIEGQVFGPDGQPAPGIIVQAKSLERNSGSRLTGTDEDGRYTLLGMAPSMTRIEASHGDEKLDGSITFAVPRHDRVTAPDLHVTEPQQGTIAVRLDGDEGIRRRVVAHEVGGDRVERLSRDSRTGLWLGEVPAGTWRVWVAGGEVLSDPVRVEHGATVDVGPLTIPSKRGRLKIKVVDKNGKPVRTGSIRISDRYGHELRSPSLYRLKKKRYTSPGLVPGTYYLSVVNPRAPKKRGVPPRPQKVVVKAGRPTKATLRLEKGRTVRGTVRHQGSRVRAIYVVTQHPGGRWEPHGRAKTDARGRYVLRHVPRGKLELRVSDMSPKFRIETIPIKARGNVSRLRIKLRE